MVDKVKCLLVDDVEENLLALEALLAGEDREIFKATSGPAALELLLVHDFALALLDIHMPTMDGLEFIRELRKNPGYESTPIYVLTSDGSRDRLAEGRAAGATAWVIKPPNVPLLVDAIVKATTTRRRANAG